MRWVIACIHVCSSIARVNGGHGIDISQASAPSAWIAVGSELSWWLTLQWGLAQHPEGACTAQLHRAQACSCCILHTEAGTVDGWHVLVHLHAQTHCMARVRLSHSWASHSCRKWSLHAFVVAAAMHL